MREFDYDMINRYLDGAMNADEAKAFEEQMRLDTELQKEVALNRDINETLKIKLQPGENETALKHTLEEMRGSYFSKTIASGRSAAKIVRFNRTRWVAAAAAVVIGIVMLTVWAPWKKEDLYQQYASVQMPGVAERGVPADSLLKLAASHFNKKEFAAAVPFKPVAASVI